MNGFESVKELSVMVKVEACTCAIFIFYTLSESCERLKPSVWMHIIEVSAYHIIPFLEKNYS